jgi:hypothetical protein
MNVSFPLWQPKFEPGSGHVGFVVGKVSLGRFSSSTSVSLAKLSTNCSTLIINHHPALIISYILINLRSGLSSLTPPKEEKSAEMELETRNVNGFEVLIAVVMKNPIFWDIMP